MCLFVHHLLLNCFRILGNVMWKNVPGASLQDLAFWRIVFDHVENFNLQFWWICSQKPLALHYFVLFFSFFAPHGWSLGHLTWLLNIGAYACRNHWLALLFFSFFTLPHEWSLGYLTWLLTFDKREQSSLSDKLERWFRE